MKITFLILLSIFICGCNLKPNKPEKPIKAGDDKIHSTSKSISKTNSDTLTTDDKDSVLIYAEEGHNGKTTKSKLKNLLKKYPELNEQLPPDVAYSRQAYCSVDFSSEVGQDEYYIMYAYFLKQHNGENKYAQQRDKLITIYRNINSIMGHLDGGNHGHLYRRIVGLAEYSLYLYKEGYYQKSYNISKQKTLYINWLKQYITDEIKSNLDILEKEKPQLKKELLNSVKEIERLITEYFYLERAQEFQFTHY